LNEETITIGNDTYKTYASTTYPYYWIAIGGLT